MAALRREVIAVYGPVCWLCGGAIVPGQAWDIDHVVPRARGGGDGVGNLRPAHAGCNRSRGAGDARVWQL